MDEALKASEEVPGVITDEIGKWCKEYDTYVMYGMGSTVPEFPKTSFDTAIIQDDKGEVVLRYHKCNPWIPDEYWPSPYDLIDIGWDLEKYPYYPVASTNIGNWGAMICNDGMTPEGGRQLAFNGAECIYHPELLMDPWVIPPLEYYELQNRWCSVTNMCYTLAPHSGWSPIQMPPYGMQGGADQRLRGSSPLPLPAGRRRGTMQTTIDIGAVRHYRQSMPTHNGLNSFKGGLFDYFKRASPTRSIRRSRKTPSGTCTSPAPPCARRWIPSGATTTRTPSSKTAFPRLRNSRHKPPVRYGERGASLCPRTPALLRSICLRPLRVGASGPYTACRVSRKAGGGASSVPGTASLAGDAGVSPDGRSFPLRLMQSDLIHEALHQREAEAVGEGRLLISNPRLPRAARRPSHDRSPSGRRHAPRYSWSR